MAVCCRHQLTECTRLRDAVRNDLFPSVIEVVALGRELGVLVSATDFQGKFLSAWQNALCLLPHFHLSSAISVGMNFYGGHANFSEWLRKPMPEIGEEELLTLNGLAGCLMKKRSQKANPILSPTSPPTPPPTESAAKVKEKKKCACVQEYCCCYDARYLRNRCFPKAATKSPANAISETTRDGEDKKEDEEKEKTDDKENDKCDRCYCGPERCCGFDASKRNKVIQFCKSKFVNIPAA